VEAETVSIPGIPAANGRVAVQPVTAEDGSRLVVMSLVGEFDMSNVHFLREQVSKTLESSPAFVVIDLGALDFADSSLLGVLVAADHRARAMGATFRIAAPPPFLQRLLALTALDTVLKVFPDLDSAKSA
jgi:anti-sigma B factor antagonist